MKLRSLTLIAAVVSLFAFPLVSEPGVRDEHPNLVGGELLGRGLLLTLNYERFVSNGVGLGFGIMAIKTSGDGIVMLPLYVSLLPGNNHSPYLSAGATLLGGTGDLQSWQDTWLIHVSAGYQYQSSGGFFVRPFFSYMRPTERGSGDQYLVWPGLTIGGSF
jgi:hypothetical protein